MSRQREQDREQDIAESDEDALPVDGDPDADAAPPGEDEDWEEEEDPVAELLFDILDYFGLDAEIEYEEREDHVRYHIEGPDMGVLIGRRGSTLEALQFLVGVINARKNLADYRVVIDVEGYRERRERQLRELAKKSASRVQREGRCIVLAPMSAGDRRVVHLALANHASVHTYSEGEDPERCVVVAPGRPE